MPDTLDTENLQGTTAQESAPVEKEPWEIIMEEFLAADSEQEAEEPAEPAPAAVKQKPAVTKAKTKVKKAAEPEPERKPTWVTGIFAVLFSLCGIAAVAAVLFVCIRFSNAQPILLSAPEDAVAAVTGMLDSVCEGDYQSASTYMLGNPDLGADREAADELGILFWDAIQDSMSYELVGESYVTDTGLAQNIKFTFLDLNSLTTNLRERSTAMLEERVQEAEDPAEIYDEDNNYREDVVMDVLYEAAEIAIKEDGKNITVELTVNLKYQNGHWWIVADKALLDAISGGILF